MDRENPLMAARLAKWKDNLKRSAPKRPNTRSRTQKTRKLTKANEQKKSKVKKKLPKELPKKEGEEDVSSESEFIPDEEVEENIEEEPVVSDAEEEPVKVEAKPTKRGKKKKPKKAANKGKGAKKAKAKAQNAKRKARRQHVEDLFEEENVLKIKKIAPRMMAHLQDKKLGKITSASLMRFFTMNDVTYRKNGKDRHFSIEQCQKMVDFAGEVLGKVDPIKEEYNDSDEEIDDLDEYLLRKRDENLGLGYANYRMVGQEEDDFYRERWQMEEGDLVQFLLQDKKFHYKQLSRLEDD